MRTTDIEMMIETYRQAENKMKAIRNLGKMFDLLPSEIMEKLEKNGIKVHEDIERETNQRPKKRIKTEGNGAEVVKEIKVPGPQAPELPMPDYILEILFKEVSVLERKMDALKDELRATEDHYKVLKDYLKL